MKEKARNGLVLILLVLMMAFATGCKKDTEKSSDAT
jgi:hypothetical protein